KGRLWANKPCMIVKDSSVSDMSSRDMKRRIENALEKTRHADLFFLCKWNDECQKYSNVTDCDTLKWTHSSCATQAVMYSPKGRDLVMRELKNNKMTLSA